MTDEFGKALDTLESAYSDSSRQGLRRIKAEWQSVLKYKNDLLAKENEIAAVKDKVTYLKELKCHNEKYLYTAKSKLQNLKQSDIQLKGKLSDLKKEEARLAEKCQCEEEYMQKKLSFYMEKWQKRQEIGDSKNPQFLEKQRAIFEMEELKRRLLSAEQDLQRLEKDLFQAKCERNRRTREEKDSRSFENFVVKIAQMYVDARKMFAECDKTSAEIRTIEKSIEERKAKLKMGLTDGDKDRIVEDCMDNLNVVGGESSSEMEGVEEIDREGQHFGNNLSLKKDQSFLEASNDDRTAPQSRVTANLEKDSHYTIHWNASNVGSNAESKVTPSSNFEHFQNKSVEDKMTESVCGGRTTSDGAKKENFESQLEKMPSRESKARKWMEKLRIHVPDFGCNEKAQNEDRSQKKSSEGIQCRGTNEEKPFKAYQSPETVMNSHNSIRALKYGSFQKDSPLASDTYADTLKSSDRDKLSSSMKKQISDKHIDAHMSEQMPSVVTNRSKYFGTNHSTSAMDWDDVSLTDKNETAEVSLNENKEQNIEASAATAQNNPTNENDCAQKEECKRYERLIKMQTSNDVLQTIQEEKRANIPEEKRLEKANIPEKKRLEKANILFGPEDKSVDVEMVEITTEVNASPNYFNKIDITDSQMDDLRADLRTLLEQNKKRIARQEDLSAVYPKPIAENATMPTEEPIAEAPPSEEPFNELNPAPVPTFEQGGGNEKKVSAHKVENDIQPLDSAENTQQKSSSENTIDNVSDVESNSKIAAAKPAESPGDMTTQEAMTAASDFPPFKADNPSPGFAYTTRLMFEVQSSSPGDVSKITTHKDLPKDVLAQLAYFNKSPGSNMAFPPSLPKTPEDDRSEAFLASAYEDYLQDSPPVIKEKSMFQFADDSPEKGIRNEFFPLFGNSNNNNNNNNSGESSKDSKGGQFTFNFGGGDEKSPEETSGFKFLF